MDPAELMRSEFWEDDRPVVFAAPGMEEQSRGLEVLLAGEEWARGAVVFASSGSTGAPKWVLHRRASLLASAAMVNAHLGVSVDDSWLLALPRWHVGGCGVAARAHVAGCGYGELEGRWDVAHFVGAVAASGATCVSLVPTQVHDLVSAGVRAPDSMRVVVVGGGALDRSVGNAARDLGWPVVQSYGMTEAASQIATAPLRQMEEGFDPDGLLVLPGWDVEADESGLLKIRGEALFDGYVVEREGGLSLLRDFEEGWFTTSDVVQLIGGKLTFCGRKDRTVKILGELVEVDRLERELLSFTGTDQELRIVEVRDERVGYRLVPVVEGGVLGWEARVEKFNEGLPGFARLMAPVAVEEFPRTALGKVDLEALRRLAAGCGSLGLE